MTKKKIKTRIWKEEFNDFAKRCHGWGVYSLEKDDLEIYINYKTREVHTDSVYQFLKNLPKQEFKSLKYFLKKFSVPQLPICPECEENQIVDYNEYCAPCMDKKVQEMLDEIRNAG